MKRCSQCVFLDATGFFHSPRYRCAGGWRPGSRSGVLILPSDKPTPALRPQASGCTRKTCDRPQGTPMALHGTFWTFAKSVLVVINEQRAS